MAARYAGVFFRFSRSSCDDPIAVFEKFLLRPLVTRRCSCKERLGCAKQEDLPCTLNCRCVLHAVEASVAVRTKLKNVVQARGTSIPRRKPVRPLQGDFGRAANLAFARGSLSHA